MGSSNSSEISSGYVNEPRRMYFAPRQNGPMVMSCAYARAQNVGSDDLFGCGHLAIARSKNKELQDHPLAMRSQSETKNLVDMNPDAQWSMDQTNNLRFIPSKKMITGGKPCSQNVTGMARLTRGGEFGNGPNNIDSVSKHCNYRVKTNI